MTKIEGAELRPAQGRQARPYGGAAARLRRRRQRPDRAGPGAGAADARRGVPCAQRASTLRGQSVRLSVVSASRASIRRWRWPACAVPRPSSMPSSTRRWPSTGSTKARPAGRLLAGHDDGAACRPAPRHAARRHRRLLRHAGRAGDPEGRDQVAAADPAGCMATATRCCRIVLSERAAEALRQNGVEVGVHIAEGVGHGIDDTGLLHAARFLLEAFKLPMPQIEKRDDRGHLQAGLRAHRRGLQAQLRRTNGEVGASVCADGGRRERSSICGAASPIPRPGAVEQGHGRASSSPAPRARRRSAPMCWRAAASSTSMRRSIELWPEFGQNGKERVTTRMMLDHSAGGAGAARQGEGQRTLRMGLHDRAPGRRGAVLGARHAQRLSRLHLRLDGRRDGAARLGQVARHVLPGRSRQAARPRLLDRPARGDRAPGRADHARTSTRRPTR